MRIKKIELVNFKRFSDLIISEIPESSKLVLLIGSNGSGKSSLFDAFDWFSRGNGKGFGQNWENYYPKTSGTEPKAKIEFHDSSTIERSGEGISGGNLAKKFIGRSSIRIVPRITNNTNLSLIKTDQDGPQAYIDNDQRFINDISQYIDNIDQALREPVFKGQDTSPLQIFRQSIEPLNKSLLNIFGGDKNTTIQIASYSNAKNNEPAKLIFTKGASEINYELLSHGEKQVVILLINFIVREDLYKNSVIFIDEMDCHLNTALQYSLLEEISSRWIPENSQLWTASHALGFIDYANKSESASIIDFDLLNFDQKQELNPLEKNNGLDVYKISVPKDLMSQILVGKELILCENQNDKFYSLIGLKDKIFSGVRDSRDLFLKVKNDTNIKGLRDRDWISDEEIRKIEKKYQNYKILKYRNFENYLYHPDNIAELGIEGFNKDAFISEITQEKEKTADYTLANLEHARQNYEEFKTDQNLKDQNRNSIVDSLKSQDFEEFYKFYDMKKHNKEFLSKLNIKPETLAKTNWFKEQIKNIL